MFKIESNIGDLKNSVKAKFNELIDVDKVLREAALDAVVLVSNRVQNEGKKTNGELIGGGKYSTKKLTSFTTGSGQKAFNFSDVANKKQQKKQKGDTFEGGYKEFREKAGREVEFIDLTLTGDMFGDFIAAPDGKTGYVVGFRGQLSSDKADWNERRFGTIFQLSDSETNFIQEKVKTKINAILSRSNK